MYASFDKVKVDLGLTDNSKDTILAQLCDDTDAYLNSMLQIEWFDKWVYTDSVQMKFVNKTTIYSKLYLNNFNVASISKINWIAYTGVLGTDYMIQHSRVVHLKDLYKYLMNLSFPYFDVEYTAGWDRSYWVNKIDTLPSDIEVMARLLVVWLYMEKYPLWYNPSSNGVNGMWNITNYKLWDEQIQIWAKFWPNGTFVTFRNETERTQFQQLFTKYKKAYVV